MADPISIVIITLASEAVLSALAGTGIDSLFRKLKKDPTKKALKKALGNTIGKYVKGKNLSISKPLLTKKGFLDDEKVASEIAKLLKVNENPDYEIIAAKWKALVEGNIEDFDFKAESKLLLNILKDELRSHEIFRSVLETQDISQMAVDTSSSASSLGEIESTLVNLSSLIDTKYNLLVDHFNLNLSDNIQDFTHYIEEKTRGFVGRKWIFDLVKKFISNHSSGYYFILGDPGIGKTALACQLVKEEGFFHHFNIRRIGLNTPTAFLKNICSQLISVYKLSHNTLPYDFAENGNFFKRILYEVSDALPQGGKCIIVIDALDEVDQSTLSKGINLLFLPKKLPPNVQIIVTLRNDLELKPVVEFEPEESLIIKHDSSENLHDIGDFIQSSSNKPELKNYVKKQKITKEEFVSYLVNKSEGNFMYLYYVIPELSKGVYKNLEINDIPTGLKGYYQDHWSRMRGIAGEEWFQYKLPILVILAVIEEPISIDLISDLSNIDRRARIRATINEWSQFLHKEYFYPGEGKVNIPRYRIYHETFQEFIAAKEEVEDEKVDLQDMHKKIANNLWDSIFEEE